MNVSDRIRELLTEATELWLAQRIVDDAAMYPGKRIYGTIQIGEWPDAGGKWLIEPNRLCVNWMVEKLKNGNTIP